METIHTAHYHTITSSSWSSSTIDLEASFFLLELVCLLSSSSASFCYILPSFFLLHLFCLLSFSFSCLLLPSLIIFCLIFSLFHSSSHPCFFSPFPGFSFSNLFCIELYLLLNSVEITLIQQGMWDLHSSYKSLTFYLHRINTCHESCNTQKVQWIS